MNVKPNTHDPHFWHSYAAVDVKKDNNKTSSKIKENEDIQDILPDDYSYVVESQTSYHCEDDLCAPKSFEVSLWCNFTTVAAFENWLSELQNKTKSVYRVTTTYKPTKHVTYKTDRHCQHRARKYYTKPQPKKKKTDQMAHGSRSKMTGCKSTVKATIYRTPTDPAHSCNIRLNFIHNHPIASDHVLSFRDISDVTKARFCTLFKHGHSVASAKLTNETDIQLNCNDEKEVQAVLADRSCNPSHSDLHRLRRKWLEEEVGRLRGTPMFEETEKIDNREESEEMQSFETGEKPFIDCETDNIEETSNDFQDTPSTEIKVTEIKVAKGMAALENIYCDLKLRLSAGEPGLLSGVDHFCSMYRRSVNRDTFACPKLASLLHSVGNTPTVGANSSGYRSRRPGLIKAKSLIKAGRSYSKKQAAVCDQGLLQTQNIKEGRLDPETACLQ